MLTPFFQVLSRGKLTILLFHKVPETRHQLLPFEMNLAEFEKTILLAMQIFKILPLDAALQALRAGNLPNCSACITFDDGYPDWLNGVALILGRLGIHATFFITTGQLNDGPMWNERVLHSVSNAPQGTQNLTLIDTSLPVLSFSSHVTKRATLNSFEQFLKYQSKEAREHYISILDAHTGVNSMLAPSMSSAAVRELHSKGFDIGGHAVSHPILTRCSPEEAYKEIAGSKETLESLICGKVKLFAYPNGIPERDFNSDHIEMVARAGYCAAVTTQKGFACAKTLPFQIPRFTPWGPSPSRMKFQLARNFMQKALNLKENKPEGRRALMIAFHFPPQAGSSGILRTLNFVKHLPEQGWNSSLLAADPRAFEEQRNDLVAEIPACTRVLRALALDAARHLSIKGKYPRLFALPDRWSSWWLPAVWCGIAEIKKQRPDLIWSTYPIATAHLIGVTLSKLSGLPWVADFRDPMVSSGYPVDRAQRRVWRWLEARVVDRASACVFTTASAADAYRKRYPEHAAKCFVIENGYDEDAFEQAQPNREGVPAHKLLLLHSGLIYPQDRNPTTFFAALRALIDKGVIDAESLCVRFRAPHHDEEVMACANRYGLHNCVEVTPPVTYQRAIAEMMGADMLLVFQGSNFNTQIPAKIYEYLRAGKPIFAVIDPKGGTAVQLARFGATHVADIASTGAIQESMLQALSSHGNAEELKSLACNRTRVKEYSRKAQTARLRDLFDTVVIKNGQKR